MTTFPSKKSLEDLAAAMNANEGHFAELGVVDCKVGLRVSDTDEGFTVEFERYGVVQVTEGWSVADFVLDASGDVWQAMYDDIVRNGSASRDQTLNYLALPGIAMRVTSDDQLAEDLFYRYNQTLQSFVDGAASLAEPVPAGEV
jgi:hypothetical protein